MKAFAADLGRADFRVNALAPGTVPSPLTEHYFEGRSPVEALARTVPTERADEPREIANALFLNSDMACITGVVLPVDGGWVAEKGTVSSSFLAERDGFRGPEVQAATARAARDNTGT